MPEYLAPGVYVEEVSSGSKPIEGVSTSTTGFLGLAERGPERPMFVTSWLQFQRWYGEYIFETSFLAYAVEGFFQNGGQRCFVSRIVFNGNDTTPASQLATGTVDTLSVWAVGRGEWGNRIRIRVDVAERSPDDEEWYQVQVGYFRNQVPASLTPESFVRDADVLEVYNDVSTRIGASNNIVTMINAGSHLIRVAWDNPSNASLAAAVGNFVPLANGSDSGPVTAGDFVGDIDFTPGIDPEHADLLGRGRGLAAFETIDEISLLVVPDEAHPNNDLSNVTEAVINQCQNLKDRFAIVSAQRNEVPIQDLNPTNDTTYAGFYYPWIRVYDPAFNGLRLIPPTGHIAGIFARTDVERGVHKAPANAVVRGARDIQFPVTKQDQALLNPRGVNCIRDFRSDGRGIRLWGARTMTSDPEWKYVNVRRLFLFVEESIDEGTQWVVFEPNHEPTWAAVVRNVTNFLISVWRSGALMGITQDEAFFVKCDRTTMTEDDINNGRLICYIGIAPVKPAEFVIFRISQKTLEATG